MHARIVAIPEQKEFLRSHLAFLISRFTVFFLPNDEQFHRRHQNRQCILQIINYRHYVVINLEQRMQSRNNADPGHQV